MCARLTAKPRNIRFYPAQSGDLIVYSIIADRMFVVEAQKAEKAKTILNCDDDHIVNSEISANSRRRR